MTVTERVGAALEAARRARDDYGAFVSLRAEPALAEARRLDTEGEPGPLHGVTLAVKDNIDVAGMWTRCGTPGLGHRYAERDADVVAALRAAGAVVLGKTRMHELAWGMTTPGARNPADPSRGTGGSSGGSAAAVAAGAVDLALGTDTGGSIRNPAALCGVLGVKTGLGELPLTGVAPLAPTQDTLGLFAADARTAMRALRVLGVPDAPPPARVGLLTDGWANRVQPEVAAAVEDAAARLAAAGVDTAPTSVPRSELASAASYLIMLAEAARQWWPETGEPPLGAVSGELRALLRQGAGVCAADYARAMQARDAIRAELAAVLDRFDGLLLAASPVPAAPLGSRHVPCAGRTVPAATAYSAPTALASVAGLPAVSVPVHESGELPLGAQLVGTETAALCRAAERIAATGRRTGRPVSTVRTDSPRQNDSPRQDDSPRQNGWGR